MKQVNDFFNAFPSAHHAAYCQECNTVTIGSSCPGCDLPLPSYEPTAPDHRRFYFATSWDKPTGNLVGVELTTPCSTGRIVANIDPQHTGVNFFDRGTTAIEAAMQATDDQIESLLDLGRGEPLTLVTTRPDPDSLGAMAVIAMRAVGYVEYSRETVAAISAADAHDRGKWAPGKVVAPTSANPWPGGGGIEATRFTAMLGALCANRSLPLETRVMLVGAWLARPTAFDYRPTGTYVKWYDLVEVTRRALIESLEARETVVKTQDGVAVVKSPHIGAMAIGYSQAPVVIACNPGFEGRGWSGLKYTIAQYGPGYVNVRGVADKLNELEPGWGGADTICGSPQDRPSQLTAEKVLSIVLSSTPLTSPGTLGF